MTTARLLGAFLHRDWHVALSYRMQFVLEFLETIGEVVLLFYLGKFVDRGDFETDVGVTTDYFSFAALGLALLNLFFTALNAFSVTLRIEQTTGSLEALLTTPPRAHCSSWAARHTSSFAPGFVSSSFSASVSSFSVWTSSWSRGRCS
ncbi:MAG: hypothetical protein H0U31_05200 [Chloroflexia bacterium]|nr:hypothetical protein [Chloroflexia bacterium]